MVVCCVDSCGGRQVLKRKNKAKGVEQGKTVGPQVYEILKQRIVQGELVPGRRISEAEISQKLEVSRQPVREAFLKLRDEGLVEIRPQRGTVVTKISVDAVNDARFIREAIEADIIRLLAEQGDPAVVESLRELVLLQRKVPENEPEKFIELDERFHRTMAEAAGKLKAWGVIANMKAHLDRVRYLSSTEKPMQRLADQHEAVVEAIASADPGRAEKAIRGHLREVLIDLPKVMSAKPEMFEEND